MSSVRFRSIGAFALSLLLCCCLLFPVVGAGAADKVEKPWNKKAIMLMPATVDLGAPGFPEVEESLLKAGYQVDKYPGDQATIERFKELNNYSVIFIFAHGNAWSEPNGNPVCRISTAIPYTYEVLMRYHDDFQSGRLGVNYRGWRSKGWVEIRNSFFSHHYENKKFFPNSIFFTFSCLLMSNDALYRSLTPWGVVIVMGYNRLVTSGPGAIKFDDGTPVNFFAKATEPNVSAQDAYNSIKDSTLTTEGYLVFQTSTSYPGDEPYYLNYKGGEKKPPDVGEEEAVRRAAKEYAKGMSRVMWNPEVGFHNAKIIGEWASVTVVAPEGYAECGYHIICKKEGGEWRGVAWGYFRDDLEERAPGCPEELLQLGRGPRDGD